MLIARLMFLFILSLAFLHEGVLADDRVQYDWFNASTLNASRGLNIVQQAGSNMNMNFCSFENDIRYVDCIGPFYISTYSSEVNPLTWVETSIDSVPTYFGIFLYSPPYSWEDKIFGQRSALFDLTTLFRIDDHKLFSNNTFSLYLQPISTQFPTVYMRLYLMCDNETTIYVGTEMDLTPFINSSTRATYQVSVNQSLTQICHEACAELSIQGIQRNLYYPHKFRAGHLCSSLHDSGVSVIASSIGLMLMIVILMFHGHFAISS